ncbi:hypothetical protein [Acrocarpospora sp. B8E8]|uniref:RCC1-like domain-containing protein n=1 Tax=Acrocarpospora sp. B8E8 TaxID=3153572 RepID=UPI00325ECFAA
MDLSSAERSRITALSAWGRNHLGQAGDGTTTDLETPAQVSRRSPIWRDISNVRQIAASSDFSALVRADGALFRWGNRRFGDRRYRDNYATVPEQIPGLSGIVQVSLGAKHILALGSDGTVWAWGDNEHWQLGDGTTIRRSVPHPVSGLTGIVQVSAGHRFSLALAQDGTVHAWGHNGYAELGDGTTANRATPIKIPSLSDVTRVAASSHGEHALAIRADATVWAWGHNRCGQLGMGCNTPRYAPAQVPGLADVSYVSAGEHSSFAITNRAVWAWGSNSVGQLGDGTTVDRRSPVPLTLTDVVQVEAGGGPTTAALRGDGTVWTWGGNDAGALGCGLADSHVDHPRQVPGVSDAIQVAVGTSTVLTLRSAGRGTTTTGSTRIPGTNPWGSALSFMISLRPTQPCA